MLGGVQTASAKVSAGDELCSPQSSLESVSTHKAFQLSYLETQQAHRAKGACGPVIENACEGFRIGSSLI
jgi:hypothetical protein